MESQLFLPSPAKVEGPPVVLARGLNPTSLDVLLRGTEERRPERQQQRQLLPAAGAYVCHDATAHRVPASGPPKLALRPVAACGLEAPAAALAPQAQPPGPSPSLSLFHTLFPDSQPVPGQQRQQGQQAISIELTQPTWLAHAQTPPPWQAAHPPIALDEPVELPLDDGSSRRKFEWRQRGRQRAPVPAWLPAEPHRPPQHQQHPLPQREQQQQQGPSSCQEQHQHWLAVQRGQLGQVPVADGQQAGALAAPPPAWPSGRISAEGQLDSARLVCARHGLTALLPTDQLPENKQPRQEQRGGHALQPAWAGAAAAATTSAVMSASADQADGLAEDRPQRQDIAREDVPPQIVATAGAVGRAHARPPAADASPARAAGAGVAPQAGFTSRSPTAPAPAGPALPAIPAGTLPGPSGSPGPPTEYPLGLSAYLPADLAAAMQSKERGPHRIAALHPWQAACLSMPEVLPDKGRLARNLLLTAPTGSGKGAVAHIILLRALAVDPSRKAMLVMPLVAGCRDQARQLRPLVEALGGKEVKCVFGGRYDSAALSSHCGVLVCTPEIAQSILNRLLISGVDPAREFSCIVVDEVHLVDDASRGALYELLLSKLRYLQARAEHRAREAAAAAGGPAAEQAAMQGAAPEQGASQLTCQDAQSPAAAPAAAPLHRQQHDPKGDSIKNGSQAAGCSGGGASSSADPGSATWCASQAAVRACDWIQLVAMSATVPGARAMARWLAAEYFSGSHRPKELRRYLLMPTGQVLDDKLRCVRSIARGSQDALGVAALCQEAADAGHSALVFCATKRGAEAEAARLAAQLTIPEPAGPPQGAAGATAASGAEGTACGGGDDECSEGSQDDRSSLTPCTATCRAKFAARLRELGEQKADELAELVTKGVAFHNSDLSRDARQLVEKAVTAGAVSVICSTTTLGSSVNLPIFRVIFREAYVSSDEPANWLSSIRYHQMAGRAGRPMGHAEVGEAYLVHSDKRRPPLEHLQRLLRSTMADSADSRLAQDGYRGLRGALLEAVAGCGARTAADLSRYMHCLLAYTSIAAEDDALPAELGAAGNAALRWLRRPELPWIRDEQQARALSLVRVPREGEFEATPLGMAVFESAMCLEDALPLYCDLQRANRCLDLERGLQLAFLSVPGYSSSGWELDREQWRRLGQLVGSQPCMDERQLLRELGINASQHGHFRRRLREAEQPAPARSMPAVVGAAAGHQERLCSRLFVALALEQLVAESPEERVAADFSLRQQDLAALREQCARFAGRAAAFALRVGYHYLAPLLRQFQRHVVAGSRMEVMELEEVKCMDVHMARLLYSRGLTSLQALAEVNEEAIYCALCDGPRSKRLSASQLEERRRQQARDIHTAAVKALEDPLRGVKEWGAGQGSATWQQKGGRRCKRTGSAGGIRHAKRARLVAGGVGQAARGGPEEGREEEQEEEHEEEAAEPDAAAVQVAVVRSGLTQQNEGQQGQQLLQQQAVQALLEEQQQLQAEQQLHLAEPLQAEEQHRSAEPLQPEQQHEGQKPEGMRLAAPLQQPRRLHRRRLHRQWEDEADQAGAAKRHEVEQPGSWAPPGTQAALQGQGTQQSGQQQHRATMHGSRLFGGGCRASAGAQQPSLAALPGCGLQVLSQLADVQRLCSQLSCATDLGCLGFALHLHSQPCSTGLPQAPSGKRAAKAARQQQQQQAGGPASALPIVDNESGPAAAEQLREGALLGVGFSWCDGGAAYIPLAGLAGAWAQNEDASSRGEGGGAGSGPVSVFDSPAAQAMAALLSHAGSGGPAGSPLALCITVGLQQQHAALQRLLGFRAALPPRLIDVRLAAWLRYPSSHRLQAVPGEALEAVALRTLGKVANPQYAVAATAGMGSESAAAAMADASGPDPPAGWLAACRAAAASRAAWRCLLPQLQSIPRLIEVLVQQEMPLAGVLADMQAVGIRVDTAHLRSLRGQLQRRIREIEEEEVPCLLRCSGVRRAINLGSHLDVRWLLYTQLQLAPPPGTQTRGGQPSTGKEALKRLLRQPGCHPVVPLIGEARQLRKSLEAVRDLLQHPHQGSKEAPAGDGLVGAGRRVHSPLFQTNTDRGRLAMHEPSLQCTPRAHELRRLRRQTLDTVGGLYDLGEANVRKGLAAAPGCVILSADYRQIELRMLAHFSGDEALCAMLADGQQDPFALLAASWLGKPLGEVGPKDRERVKQCVYAVLYGMGSFRLGEDLQGMTAQEASKVKEAFLDSLPRVKAYLQQAKDDCRRLGYVEMLSGRRRWLPYAASAKSEERSAADRAAVNTIMQGSAADVCKRAMVDIHRQLAALPPPRPAALVLQIHDELLLEVESGRLQEVAELVRRCMERSYAEVLRVPLRVRLAVGPSWGELRDLALPSSGGAEREAVEDELQRVGCSLQNASCAPSCAEGCRGGCLVN
ncbi:hypothetical protein ABPG77_002684 [Micractinium sp. CCAP 211/92]